MSKNSIDDLLFKPLVLTEQEGEKLIVIYSYDHELSKCLNIKGKTVTNTVINVQIYDITASMLMDEPILTVNQVTDIKKFREAVQEADPKAYAEELAFATNMLMSEMNSMSIRLQALAKAFTTLRFVDNSVGSNRNNLIENSESDNVFQIDLNAITGNKTELGVDDATRATNLIYDIIMHNLSTDTNDEAHIRKLKAEIEYKLIETLPNTLKAGELNIDMQPILDQIRLFQGNTDEEI
jgi:hypothetical protein